MLLPPVEEAEESKEVAARGPSRSRFKWLGTLCPKCQAGSLTEVPPLGMPTRSFSSPRRGATVRRRGLAGLLDGVQVLALGPPVSHHTRGHPSALPLPLRWPAVPSLFPTPQGQRSTESAVSACPPALRSAQSHRFGDGHSQHPALHPPHSGPLGGGPSVWGGPEHRVCCQGPSRAQRHVCAWAGNVCPHPQQRAQARRHRKPGRGAPSAPPCPPRVPGAADRPYPRGLARNVLEWPHAGGRSRNPLAGLSVPSVPRAYGPKARPQPCPPTPTALPP